MTISVIKENDLWIIRSAFTDKDIVKAAGCRWNPDRRVWWTDKDEVAAKLAKGDFAAVAAINAERQVRAALSRSSIDASRAASADIAVPAPQGLAYLPYQLAGVAYAQARTDTLIADEMGLGKTIQALGVINADKSIAQRAGDLPGLAEAELAARGAEVADPSARGFDRQRLVQPRRHGYHQL